METSSTATTSVAILDEQATIAAGLASLIGGDSRFAVSGLYTSVTDLEAALATAVPDALVIDIQLGGSSVTTAIREWHFRHPGMGILVFSSLDSRTYVHDAIAYGALGYLSKSAQQDQLLEAISAVSSGKHFFGAELGKSIANMDDTESPVKALSDRELDVLRRLALGFSPKEIGFELDLSDKTIHAHKNSIRQKLGLRRQSDLIRAAFSAGIVNVQELVG